MPRAQQARSVSGDSFGDSGDEAAASGAGSGRKTKESAKDVDQRKVQNRIAQREFRQRKQQYIKDLEARVQLHESSRDDQLDKMRTGIKALIDENQKLRELLASVAGFIGNGIGGILPQVGIDLPEFQALINRNRTEHIFDAINSTGSMQEPVNDHDKRASFTNPNANATAGPSSKRARTDEVDSPMEMASSAAASMYHLPSLGESSYPGAPTAFGAAMYAPRASSSAAGSPAVDATQRDAEALEALRPKVADTPGGDVEPQEETIQELFSMPTDNPKLQAIQLISYHMANKRNNPSYHLPPSLKATVTQQTVPHSPFFDGIIFSSLRDRLILLKDQHVSPPSAIRPHLLNSCCVDRYDLRTLLNDLVDAVNIHEDDILLPANWELTEAFVRKYWYVVDTEVLAISNRWRRERGERELTMRELVPDGSDIAAEGALGART